jgi:hypothetical protein
MRQVALSGLFWGGQRRFDLDIVQSIGFPEKSSAHVNAWSNRCVPSMLVISASVGSERWAVLVNHLVASAMMGWSLDLSRCGPFMFGVVMVAFMLRRKHLRMSIQGDVIEVSSVVSWNGLSVVPDDVIYDSRSSVMFFETSDSSRRCPSRKVTCWIPCSAPRS